MARSNLTTFTVLSACAFTGAALLPRHNPGAAAHQRVLPARRSVLPRAAAKPDALPEDAYGLPREMLEIGAPAFVGLAIDPLASLADTAFIGRLCGPGALAGAGVAISVFNLVSKTFNFLSSATTSMVASVSSESEARLAAPNQYSHQPV